MVVTSDAAPDFVPGYPSKGERIGPAWQRTWWALADQQWQAGATLARSVATISDLNETTVMNLLAAAAKAGLIEREMRFAGTRKTRGGTSPIRTVWYRRRGDA